MVAIGCLAVVLAGCAGAGGAGGGDDAALVDGQTFTVVIPDDPGTLDPALSLSSDSRQMSRFLYDTLTLAATDGSAEPNLAETWEATTTEAEFTLRKGITCSDGTELTAETVAANINFIADPENGSPLLGIDVQPGTVAIADNAAGTVSVQSGAPDPFLLRGLSNVRIVCQAGLDDRSLLRAGSAGTGLFTLTKAAANDRYTLTRRDGYEWAPGDGEFDTKGLPETVVFRVVDSESTSANLLLSGEVNAARITGTDTARLQAANLREVAYASAIGQLWFNEAAGHPTSDEQVRKALLAALDLEDLRTVLTDGKGTQPERFSATEPSVCQGDLIDGIFPKFDAKVAATQLDEAGWKAADGGIREKDGTPLSIKVLYPAAEGARMVASMEFVQTAWTAVGVDVELVAANDALIGQALDETGDFDVHFVNTGLQLPSQLVPFVSGDGPGAGLNAGLIDNLDYLAHVEAATQLPGAEGCEEWNAAETALYERADLVPFANQQRIWFSKNASFELREGTISPTTVRMRAN
ncbi:ABC transporter substrate-binding protein [Microbacterium sp. NPDC089695]|uniref:ABC transporter substrate-binding protein n=1 Tax=Microbacterium sp. NPDC089695 TaxID=3364198 RepID=UPI003824E01D